MTTASDSVQNKTARSRGHRVGLVVAIVSAAALVLAGAMVAVRVGPTFTQAMSADAHALPMDATMTLEAGTWVVYERTGSQSQTGPLTMTTNRRARLAPRHVTVTSAAGDPVPTSRVTSTQTINQNGVVYTGAVTFDVETDGEYRVRVSGARGRVLVAKDLLDLFVSSAVWVLLAIVAVIGLVTGGVLVLVGRRRQRGRQSGAATAPPGWYPNPNRPGEMLWWDGSQWHAPPAQAGADERSS